MKQYWELVEFSMDWGALFYDDDTDRRFPSVMGWRWGCDEGTGRNGGSWGVSSEFCRNHWDQAARCAELVGSHQRLRLVARFFAVTAVIRRNSGIPPDWFRIDLIFDATCVLTFRDSLAGRESCYQSIWMSDEIASGWCGQIFLYCFALDSSDPVSSEIAEMTRRKSRAKFQIIWMWRYYWYQHYSTYSSSNCSR
jgi:hypothetical protein